MNDDDDIPEDMPQEHGDNVQRSEKLIGQEAVKLAKRYDTLVNRIGRDIHEVHDVIVQLGRLLQEGRDIYGPGYEFGQWIKRRSLDKYKVCNNQQERTACMNIARLYDDGVDGEPGRLDLTECKRYVPTDIMKWARVKQPHLFPHLVRKPKKRKPAELPDDEIPDLASRDSHDDRVSKLEAELKAARKRIAELERVIAELEKTKAAKSETTPKLLWEDRGDHWLGKVNGEYSSYEVRRTRGKKYNVTLHTSDFIRELAGSYATIEEAKAACEAELQAARPGGKAP